VTQIMCTVEKIVDRRNHSVQ